MNDQVNPPIPALPAPVSTMQTPAQPLAAYSGERGFELAQRMARSLTESQLVPPAFQKNLPNALIALELAQRIGASPLMVMQNLHVVHGRPSWSSQFIVAALNSCGRFSPLRFTLSGTGDARQCVASAADKATGEVLSGPSCSIAMAKAEGWFDRSGSKWKTMPDLMLHYRAAAFFGRLYAPDVLMGMHSAEEVIDIGDGVQLLTPAASPAGAAADLNAAATRRRGRPPKAQPEPSPTGTVTPNAAGIPENGTAGAPPSQPGSTAAPSPEIF